jgi:hypothetical protein
MQDPDGFNLPAYPSVEANSGARADPYHPDLGKGQSDSGFVRYISSYGFDWNKLVDGLAATQAVSQSLDASVADKFTNIRGVQGTPGAIVNGTIVAQRWALVPSSFDPDSGADGITDIQGPGDDTLPAWSTRLLGNRHVITVKATDINHMDMMNHADVQKAIANVLAPSPMAKKRMLATAKTVKMKAASRKDLNALISTLSKVHPKKDYGQSAGERKYEKSSLQLAKAIRSDCRSTWFARASMVSRLQARFMGPSHGRSDGRSISG